MTFTARSSLAVALVAIAPAVVVVGGVRGGDPVLVAYGLAAMVGAIGAVYAGRAMDGDAVRSTIRTTLITAAILVGIMVAYRIATGGFHGNLAAALATAVVSVATYIPVVFVMEEVLFRGVLDTYLHGSTAGPDRATALYGSALWGTLAPAGRLRRPRGHDDPVPPGRPHGARVLPCDVLASHREPGRAGYRARRERRVAECSRRPLSGRADARDRGQHMGGVARPARLELTTFRSAT